MDLEVGFRPPLPLLAPLTQPKELKGMVRYFKVVLLLDVALDLIEVVVHVGAGD